MTRDELTNIVDSISEKYKEYFQERKKIIDIYRPILDELKELKKKYEPFSNTYEILSEIENVYYNFDNIDLEDNIIRWKFYDGENELELTFPADFILDENIFEKWKNKLEKEFNSYTKKKNSTIEEKKRKYKKLKKELLKLEREGITD